MESNFKIRQDKTTWLSTLGCIIRGEYQVGQPWSPTLRLDMKEQHCCQL